MILTAIELFKQFFPFPGTPILPGAVLAAVCWAIVSSIFRYYVAATFGSYHKIHGALGAVIVLQLWLYMSSWVLLLGDQLNFTVGEAIAEAGRKTAIIDGREKGSREWEVGSGEVD